MYKLLNESKETPTGMIAWNKKYDFDKNEWKRILNEPFRITRDTTMQWFQTRINHNILATNKFLTKIKIINDPKYSVLKKMKQLNISFGNVSMSKNFYMIQLAG